MFIRKQPLSVPEKTTHYMPYVFEALEKGLYKLIHNHDGICKLFLLVLSKNAFITFKKLGVAVDPKCCSEFKILVLVILLGDTLLLAK